MRYALVLFFAGCVTAPQDKSKFIPTPDIQVITAMPPKKTEEPKEPKVKTETNKKDPIWVTIAIGFVITVLLAFTATSKKE